MISVDRRTLNRIALLLLGVAGGALWLSCSRETFIGGLCGDITDCRTEYNFYGGTSCVHGVCMCDNPDLEVCCPNSDPSLCKKYTDNTCRPRAECPDTPPQPECLSSADCVQPPDPRCGLATCEQGKCGLTIFWPGPPIDWQKPGDCKTLVCDQIGYVIEQVDFSDRPIDVNPCTYDHCDESGPLNDPIPDTMPCPGSSGVCFSGECMECINPDVVVCGPSEICSGFDCVPPHCDDNAVNGGETGLDCGGGACRPCPSGQPCIKGSDCGSNVCVASKCAAPTPTDGVENGDETGVDCGCYGCTNKCKDGEGCLSDDDCMSRVCYGSLCLPPSCFDGTKNGDEEGVDCGGSCELPCSGE